MLLIVLVLLVSTSTLAAPGVLLYPVSINDVVPPEHNGGLVSAYWIDQATEIIDGGDTTAYGLTAYLVAKDLANGDKHSQALSLAETIVLLGSQATGIPGDACAAAEVIDAYVFALRSGNQAGIRAAVAKFIKSLLNSIDLICQVATNPISLRYATGPRGNCNGGGRTYQFEAAWDAILANASPSSAGLVNEQYCAAKRLYSAHSSSNNNAGAFITAASLPPVQRVIQNSKVFEALARFVIAIVKGNLSAAAAAAKKALVHVSNN